MQVMKLLGSILGYVIGALLVIQAFGWGGAGIVLLVTFQPPSRSIKL